MAFSEGRSARGAPEDEELPQENRTRRGAEGQDVPGHNRGLRHILGTAVLRHPGGPPGHRESNGTGGERFFHFFGMIYACKLFRISLQL